MLPNAASAQDRPQDRAATKKITSPRKEPLKEGRTAPMFALRQFDGDHVFLKDYCGARRKDQAVKAVLLDFFATDCAGCVAKLEDIHRLAARYSPGLKTFLISIDPKPEEALPSFLKDRKVTLPVLTDMYRKTLSNYGFRAVPQTLLLDDNCRTVFLAKKGGGFSGLAVLLDKMMK